MFRDGRWHLVEPRRDALVVNIGDIVQVWSNDRYRAALHRVVANAEHERYSAPFFFNPSYDTSYAAAADDGRCDESAALPRHQLGRVPLAARSRRLRGPRARKSRSLTTACEERITWLSSTTSAGDATDDVRAMYARQQSSWGYVPNYAKVFCHRPEVLARWGQLQAEIRARWTSAASSS